MVFGKDKSAEKDGEVARIAAAILIQRLWRGRTNKAKDEHMTSEARWEDAANSARLEVSKVKSWATSGLHRRLIDLLFALMIYR